MRVSVEILILVSWWKTLLVAESQAKMVVLLLVVGDPEEIVELGLLVLTKVSMIVCECGNDECCWWVALTPP